MAASLSAYWVKFFKGAGFPLDVATKHAVVFSNNRIKPDMLPDLDKPSLKDMGITLMGDMIAILRYAKKVVEETTCERFLVDTEDNAPLSGKQPPGRGVVKKVVAKIPSKSIPPVGKPKIIQETRSKAASRSSPASAITRVPEKKIEPARRLVTRPKSQIPKIAPAAKRKSLERAPSSESDGEIEDDDNGDPNEKEKTQERVEDTRKRFKLASAEDKVGYTVIMPKGRTTRSQDILQKIKEQKRTVFDRLGDSSVTSTTNSTEASVPTFNITGLGNDVLKRNCSVFNRLGEKDTVKKIVQHQGAGKNGTSSNVTTSAPPGILKTARPSAIGSTTVTLRDNELQNSKSTGTMRADYEKNSKISFAEDGQSAKGTRKIRSRDLNLGTRFTGKVVRKVNDPRSKLASERVGSVPAKARLGLGGSAATKQVTFDRVAKVARIQKPGVFSRLGV